MQVYNSAGVTTRIPWPPKRQDEIGASGVKLDGEVNEWLRSYLGVGRNVPSSSVVSTLMRHISSKYDAISLPAEVFVDVSSYGFAYLQIFRDANRFAVARALGKFPRLELVVPVYAFALAVGMASQQAVGLRPHVDGDDIFPVHDGYPGDTLALLVRRLRDNSAAVLGLNLCVADRLDVVAQAASVYDHEFEQPYISKQLNATHDYSIHVAVGDLATDCSFLQTARRARCVLFSDSRQAMDYEPFINSVLGAPLVRVATVASALRGELSEYGQVVVVPGELHAGVVMAALSSLSAVASYWYIERDGGMRPGELSLRDSSSQLPAMAYSVSGDWVVSATKPPVYASVEIGHVDGMDRNAGCCYLAMIRSCRRAAVFARYGRDPPLRQLLEGLVYEDYDPDAIRALGIVSSEAGLHCVSVTESCPSAARYLSSFSNAYGLKSRVADVVPSQLACDVAGAAVTVGRNGFLSTLARLSGSSLELAPNRLDLVARSVAFHSSRDKDQFRLLAAVGDAFITVELSKAVARAGLSAQIYQESRSQGTSTAALASLLRAAFSPAWFSVPSGVDAFSGKVAADFLEAIVGLLVMDTNQENALQFLVNVGLFRQFTWWRPRMSSADKSSSEGARVVSVDAGGSGLPVRLVARDENNREFDENLFGLPPGAMPSFTVLKYDWESAVRDYWDSESNESLREQALAVLTGSAAPSEIVVHVDSDDWVRTVKSLRCVVTATEDQHEQILDKVDEAGRGARLAVCEALLQSNHYVDTMVCDVRGLMLGQVFVCAARMRVKRLELVVSSRDTLYRGSIVTPREGSKVYCPSWAVVVDTD